MRSYILGHKITFFKRSDVKSRAWQVRMNIGGRSVVRSTGALNIHEAGRFAETLIRQLLGQPVGLPCSTTLSEAWSLFDRERFGTLGRNYDAALSFNQRMLDRGGLAERRIDLITKADVIEHLYAMAAGDRACVRVALGALFRPSMTTFVVNKTGLDNGHVAPLIRVATRERGRRSGRGFACRGSSTAARP